MNSFISPIINVQNVDSGYSLALMTIRAHTFLICNNRLHTSHPLWRLHSYHAQTWIFFYQQIHNNYKLSQKYHVTLKERSSRPKSLVFLELETLRCTQGDILEMCSSDAAFTRRILVYAHTSTFTPIIRSSRKFLSAFRKWQCAFK